MYIHDFPVFLLQEKGVWVMVVVDDAIKLACCVVMAHSLSAVWFVVLLYLGSCYHIQWRL